MKKAAMIKWYIMKLGCLIAFFLLSGFGGCKDAPPVVSPPGYDLGKPQKFILGDALQEISGIVFLQGNPDTLYAIEDETGRIFYFHPGDKTYSYKKFGKRGDYEDVANLDDKELVVLRSDGSLYVFPFVFVRDGNPDRVREYPQILPSGEYEGLFGDGAGRLVALCKNCPGEDDQRREVSGYVLRKDKRDSLVITEHFKVDVSGVKLKSNSRKGKFHPSCLARHPLTRDWYIISSVNKVLLILDDHWAVKASYPLDPFVFKQPEGLAFDRQGNMYISNEGKGGNANVLLFNYVKIK